MDLLKGTLSIFKLLLLSCFHNRRRAIYLSVCIQESIYIISVPQMLPLHQTVLISQAITCLTAVITVELMVPWDTNIPM